MISRSYFHSPIALRHALLLIVGALHSQAFAPYPLPAWALPYVQIACLAFLARHTLQAENARSAALHAVLFGFGQFSVGLYWLTISMHQYGGMPLAIAIAALLLFSAALSLFGALACLLSWRLLRDRIRPEPLAVILAALVWASCWTLGEWLRGTLFTGFPWLNIGYAHVEGVLAPWAALFGVYGVAWLAAFAAAAIALFMLGRQTGHDVQSAAALALSLATGLAGMGLSYISWSSPYGEPVLIRLVQGNVPQSEKFDPAHIEQGINDYMMLARLEPKEAGQEPAITVLPETVVPLLQDRVPPQTWSKWIDIARERNTTLLMGLPLHDREQGGSRYTNSTVAFDGSTRAEDIVSAQLPLRYDKVHLVPFGEFVPTGFRWFVDMMSIPLGDFHRGSSEQPPMPIAGQMVASNICYEDVFGEEIAQSVRGDVGQGGASVLVNVSNLAWFGESSALRQHLQISRMRALETARPMLRATNTGMTAAIAPDGTVRAVLQPHVKGVLDVEVQGTSGITPYVAWTNAPILIWCLLLVAGAMWPFRSNSSKRSA
ncbi:apolipoprotein N-acyltransferase [Achromobacter sp. F4_2707]|uniref:apolipoprotein N-acyltransferase n=1 Tax=Achromobacter sp. F4_2707 TaxID=3114286 RepID=UPI0039C5BFCB